MIILKDCAFVVQFWQPALRNKGCDQKALQAMVVPIDILDEATFGQQRPGVQSVKEWVSNPQNDINDNELDEWGGGDGDTLLGRASLGLRNGSDAAKLELIKYLLAHGADPNVCNRWGMTPLHHACESHLSFGTVVIPMLLAAGADVHAKTTKCGIYPDDLRPYRLRGETPLSRAVQWFRRGQYGPIPRDGLEYISLLLRHGARLDDCWGGASMEACLRHVEERLGLDPEWGVRINTNICEDIAENEHFVACKALVKKVRYERGRKTFLTLRTLALRDRATTADPILEFLVKGLPDAIAWKVISYWRCTGDVSYPDGVARAPPGPFRKKRRRQKRRKKPTAHPGTGNPPYEVTTLVAPKPAREMIPTYSGPTSTSWGPSDELTLLARGGGTQTMPFGRWAPKTKPEPGEMLVSITAMDQYRHKSVEELRLEDYELGREAGRWWPGGVLQVG